MSIVYLDGKFVDECDAKIGVMDRGFLFGDGVYATIQVNEGEPLFLSTHLERLTKQALALGIEPPTIDEGEISTLVKKNNAQNGIWKLKVIITGGSDPEMSLPKRTFGHMIFTLKPFTPAPYGPLRCALFPTPLSACHSSFKSLAHLNRYYVMEYAKKQGCDDAIVQHASGELLEASFGNIFWIINDEFFTPHMHELPLHLGVSLEQIMVGACARGYKVHLVKTTLKDMPEEVYVYRCNTMSGIRPITQIGARTFARSSTWEDRLHASMVHTSH